MTDVIELLKSASDGGRDLEIAIGQELGLIDADLVYTMPDGTRCSRGNCDPWPSWTQSIDRALNLVERVLPGWGWCMRTDSDGTCFANVFPGEPNIDRIYYDIYAATHPLALCAAVLKARTANTVGMEPQSGGMHKNTNPKESL